MLLRGRLTVLALLAFLALLPPVSARAQQPSASPAAAPIPETEEEKQERATRRACAVKVCSTLHLKQPSDGELTCSVRKSWRKEVLTLILSRGKITWPWGAAHCAGDLKLDRALLVKAMSGGEFEAQFEQHDVRCEIDSGKDKDKYDVTLQIRPKVTFKDGKAVKASLNWGKIEAPTLAKAALWSITAADNQLGVLQSTVVEDINEFIQTKCMEVKNEWQGK